MKGRTDTKIKNSQIMLFDLFEGESTVVWKHKNNVLKVGDIRYGSLIKREREGERERERERVYVWCVFVSSEREREIYLPIYYHS